MLVEQRIFDVNLDHIIDSDHPIITKSNEQSRFGVLGTTVSIRRANFELHSLAGFLDDFTNKHPAFVDRELPSNSFTPFAKEMRIQVGEDAFEIIGDAGVALHRAASGDEFRFQLPTSTKLTDEIRLLPELNEIIQTLASRLPISVDEVEILRIRVLYCKLGNRQNGILLPCVAVDVNLNASGNVSTAVVLA